MKIAITCRLVPLLAFATVASGCFDTDLEGYRCTSAGECAEGYGCLEGQCVSDAKLGDGGNSVLDAGGSDAGNPDAGAGSPLPDGGSSDAGILTGQDDGGADAGGEGGPDGGVSTSPDGGMGAGLDGGAGPGPDGGLIPPTDGGAGPPWDAGVIPQADSGVDPALDSGVAPAPDSGVNPPLDSGPFPAPDSGPVSGLDSGFDSGLNSGLDSGADSGLDSGADSGLDSGVDSGVPDAGPPPVFNYQACTDSPKAAGPNPSDPGAPAGGAVNFTDTWPGMNNSAWNATKWDACGAGGSNLLIHGGASGALKLPNAAGGFSGAVALHAPVTDADVLLRFWYYADNAGASFRVYLRASADWTDSGEPRFGYAIDLDKCSGETTLFKVVNGVATQIATGPLWSDDGDMICPADDANEFKMRFQVVGTSVRWRRWLSTDSEPSTWDIDVTDSAVTGPGNLQLRLVPQVPGQHEVHVDDLDLNSPPP
jgi:hypothetical protein